MIIADHMKPGKYSEARYSSTFSLINDSEVCKDNPQEVLGFRTNQQRQDIDKFEMVVQAFEYEKDHLQPREKAGQHVFCKLQPW